MADANARASFPVGVGDSRFDACCQLCSRIAGQVVDAGFLHHPDCQRTPVFDGDLPRCCACGGRLFLEPTIIPMSSAADREAARHHRPSRS